MRLSALQKYILLECSSSRSGRLNRSRLAKFYLKQKKKPKSSLITQIITQSIERLIDKELLVGFGVRTPHKWFIKEIKLTLQGKKQAKRLLGQQMKIPFRPLKH